MTILPVEYNVSILKGAEFTQDFIWADENNVLINLTGYTAKLKMRETIDAADSFVSLTDSAGITLGGVAGTIAVVITGAVTGALTERGGVYDLVLTSSGGIPYKLFFGTVNIVKSASR